MSTVDSLAGIFAPWQALYSDSIVISTAVITAHVLALLVGGGLAIAADRSTLRMARRPIAERNGHLRDLDSVHRPVLLALSLAFLSGVLLMAADLEAYLESRVFWLKLMLVGLLLANGAVLRRTGAQLQGGGGDGLWRRLQLASIASITLWTLTVVVGEVLVAV